MTKITRMKYIEWIDGDDSESAGSDNDDDDDDDDDDEDDDDDDEDEDDNDDNDDDYIYFSAGRRGPVTLETVLKFVTATETEPILGYTIHPHIVFDKYSTTCFPTSNTCVNNLTFPVGTYLPEDREEVFKFFDYAFASEYFGNT